jgi:hypothetical protein
MKLTSHGCSFVYGSELSSPSLAWPALIAQNLSYEYQRCAVPGSGNLQIMESVLQHAGEADFCVVNWTWIDRFDYVSTDDESWQTLRPVLDTKHADYYYRHLHSQYRDMLTNLIYISNAISFLSQQRIPFLMTYMDHLLFESVREEWHVPHAVTFLQQKVRPYMTDFNGWNFLDWSRHNGFDVSASWHPLERAHAAAAKLMWPIIYAILHKA